MRIAKPVLLATTAIVTTANPLLTVRKIIKAVWLSAVAYDRAAEGTTDMWPYSRRAA